MIAFGAGSHPLVQSVAAASVDPVVSGEVVAALEMLGHVGGALSPFAFGFLSAWFVLTSAHGMPGN
jgi:hypothetical protein